MDLRFIRGNSAAPRGHAIIIVRPYGQTQRAMATYCIVLPIQFSIGRYIPPILASQFPIEGLRDMGSGPSVMPVPPMMEDVEDADGLIALAELREDDLVEIGGLGADVEAQRMELAARASAEYHELYERYASANRSASRPPPLPLSDALANIPPPDGEGRAADPLESLLAEPSPGSEQEQLSQVASLIGTLRYAQEGRDERLVEETLRSLRRATAPLAEKYHADELLAAAQQPGERNQRLTDLYLQRAFRLAAEDYAAIPPIEQQIRELSAHD
jgi:hypothetical protein